MALKKSQSSGIIILIVVIAAIFLLNQAHYLAFFSPTTLGSGVNTNLNQAALIGGTATSLSQVTSKFKFCQSSCSSSNLCWLTSFVINGKGQAYNGTQASTAKAINSSYTSQANNPVSIHYALNSEKIIVPYTYAGYNLYKWSTTNLTIGYNFQNCPLGVVCSQSNTGSYYTFGAGVYLGGIPYSTVVSAVDGFIASCQSQQSGAVALLIQQGAIPSGLPGGIGNADAVEVQCVAPSQTN